MNTEMEGWLNRTWTKMQEIIITFKKMMDKQTQRIVYVEGKMRQIELIVREAPKYDEGDLVDLRARVANVEATMKTKLAKMLELIQIMREKQIGIDSRIETLENAIDNLNEPIGDVEDEDEEDKPFMSEAEKIAEKVDKALKDLDKAEQEPIEMPTPPTNEDDREKKVASIKTCPICAAENGLSATECSECGTGL